MECPYCHEPNSSGARFCRSCGQSLAVLVCPKCGRANSPQAKFCGVCGQSLAAQPTVGGSIVSVVDAEQQGSAFPPAKERNAKTPPLPLKGVRKAASEESLSPGAPPGAPDLISMGRQARPRLNPFKWAALFLAIAAIVSAVVYFKVISPAEEQVAEAAKEPMVIPAEQQLPPQSEEQQTSENLSPEARAAKEAYDRAFERYTSIATGGMEGDIDAALAEYKLAYERYLEFTADQAQVQSSSKEHMERLLSLLTAKWEELPVPEYLTPEARVAREAVEQAFKRYKSIARSIAAGEMEGDLAAHDAAYAELVQAIETYRLLLDAEQ